MILSRLQSQDTLRRAVESDTMMEWQCLSRKQRKAIVCRSVFLRWAKHMLTERLNRLQYRQKIGWNRIAHSLQSAVDVFSGISPMQQNAGLRNSVFGMRFNE